MLTVQDHVTKPFPPAIVVACHRDVVDPVEYVTVIEQVAPGAVRRLTSPVDPRVTGERTSTKAMAAGAAVGAVELLGVAGVTQPPAAIRPIAKLAVIRSS